METQPLRYFDRDLLPHLAHSNRLMADLINSKKEATTLIQNATVGLNAVIGGYTREYGANGTILYFDVVSQRSVSLQHEKSMCVCTDKNVDGGAARKIPL